MFSYYVAEEVHLPWEVRKVVAYRVRFLITTHVALVVMALRT